MTENRQEENGVWVEYLYDGVWLMRIFSDKLLGYLVKRDPCAYSEQEWTADEVPTFEERAKMMGLEPVRVRCIGLLFD